MNHSSKKESKISLTEYEKKIAKALLNVGKKNQEIAYLINIGREYTVNLGRISELKKEDICPAPEEEVKLFLYKKNNTDIKTGLNIIDHERLIKAREAMFLAVEMFNTPHITFKSEYFAVYVIIAWTYLVHVYCEKEGESIYNGKKTKPLLDLLNVVNLSGVIKKNLKAIIKIRNQVEHNITGSSDSNWYALFQACCLNFEKTIVEWFGEKLSLSSHLSFALQFSKLDLSQFKDKQSLNIPSSIEALDAEINKEISEELARSQEYRFRVVYTLVDSPDGEAVQFVDPKSAEGQRIQTVLIREKDLAEKYPYKPKIVVDKINKKYSRFTMRKHIDAYKKYKVRPSDKEKHNKYCMYHSTHKDYTYSQEWIDFLLSEIKEGRFKIKK